MPATAGVISCPHCGHARTFLRPPLLVVFGPVGVGKSTICARLAGTVPGAVLLDADIFGYQHESVVGDQPDFNAFWRWLAQIAHEIAQNNVVVTYFSVMLPEQLLENTNTLEYFDSVHFLYLKAPARILRDRIARQAGTGVSTVDSDSHADERTQAWSSLDAELESAALSTPNTTVTDATRTYTEVEDEVRSWINARLEGVASCNVIRPGH